MTGNLIPETTPLVLVVDDDKAFRSITSSFLTTAGLRVVEAENGAESVAAFERLRPDLVLMDVLMPVMDGFDACAAIRGVPGGRHVPVMMMTSLNDVDSIHRAYEVGATDFVTKPINLVILENRIRYMLRASQAFMELSRSEAKNRALLRAIPDPVFRIGEDGTLIELVSTNHDGHPPPGEYRGRKLEDVFPAEAAENAYRCAALSLRTGDIQVFEYDFPSRKETRRYEARIAAVGEGESLCVARDITERKKVEEHLARLAYHDPLTGLPNRLTFDERMARDLARARRKGETVGVVLIDLDRFKEINDTLGHDAGDRLLKTVAERLSSSVRATDTVARLSGDEFCVILPDQADENTTVIAAQRVQTMFSSPFMFDGREMSVTASMGFSMFPLNGDTAETLVKRADIAMFRAKAGGGDALRMYSEEMSAVVARRIEMARDLRDAAGRGEFVVHYLPEADLRTGRIVGAEALVRWMRPGEGIVHPLEFMPVAEEAGVIVPMTEVVIASACAMAKAWQSGGHSPFRVSVNISGRLFQQYDLAGTIARVLGETGLDPGSLEVEVSDVLAARNKTSARDRLWTLHRLGVRVAMDAFGTGGSSLAWLGRFPFRVLKIDRLFIKDIARKSEGRAIVEAIIAMAHAMDMEVIAEGVETADQLEFLKARGCDRALGFLFGKPLPAGEFTDLLARNRSHSV